MAFFLCAIGHVLDNDAALLRRLPATGELIALEPGGEAWDTAKLTTYIEQGMLHGQRAVTFLIGGSDGLPKAAVARAHRRLSRQINDHGTQY